MISLGSCLYETDGTQAPSGLRAAVQQFPHLAPCHTRLALRAPPSAAHTASLLSESATPSPSLASGPSSPALESELECGGQDPGNSPGFFLEETLSLSKYFFSCSHFSFAASALSGPQWLPTPPPRSWAISWSRPERMSGGPWSPGCPPPFVKVPVGVTARARGDKEVPSGAPTR